MSAPSGTTDADLSPYNNDVYFALEHNKIWKTNNLTATGSATWDLVWDSGDFVGSEFGELLRVRCAQQENLVYALGWGYDAESIAQAFCLRTEDAGATWSQYWVVEIDDPEDGSIRYLYNCFTAGGNPSHSQTLDVVFEEDNEGDITIELQPKAGCINQETENCIQWPGNTMSAVIELHPPIPTGLGYYPSIEWDISGNWPSEDYDEDGDGYPMVAGWCNTAPVNTSGGRKGVYGDPLTTHATATLDNRYVQDRIAIGWGWGFPGRDEECHQVKPDCGSGVLSLGVISNLVIESVSYDKEYPTRGFDVAYSNPDYVYVGLSDKIMQSTDGGVTWEEWITDYGAHDICSVPQIADAIYYWDTDGELRLGVSGYDQGSILSSASVSRHGRIAHDIDSGKVWVIDGIGNLQHYESGAWTTQMTGLSIGMALKSYQGGLLICADSSNIYLSTDYGISWEEKVGDWAAYANPAATNLMDNDL